MSEKGSLKGLALSTQMMSLILELMSLGIDKDKVTFIFNECLEKALIISEKVDEIESNRK